MNRIRVLAMLEARFLSGSAKAVLEFAKETSRQYPDLPRIELSVLTFVRGHDENALTKTVREIATPLDVVMERGRFDMSVISQLRASADNRQPDIIWSNSVKSHFLVRWAGLNRLRRWVAFHHGYTTTDIKMRLYNQLDSWSLRKADQVLTSSAAFVKQLVRKNIHPERIHVRHMPIRPFPPVSGTRKVELRRELGIDDRTRVLLSVGRLSREKGHVDLVRAVSRIRKIAGDMRFRLILVGEGPERPRIEKLRRNMELADVITLTGHQSDINPYYAIADVFLLPSLSEGCPNVLLEAMAAGVPVVATAVGGVPEIVTNGKDAILVEKHDGVGIALAAVELLRDEPLRDRLISNAREIVSRKSPEAYFRSIVSIFRRACTDGECRSSRSDVRKCGLETDKANSDPTHGERTSPRRN